MIVMAGCVTERRVHAQVGTSCLYIACTNAHLNVVKYLCELGGEKLLMLTNNVSELRGVSVRGRLCA